MFARIFLMVHTHLFLPGYIVDPATGNCVAGTASSATLYCADPNASNYNGTFAVHICFCPCSGFALILDLFSGNCTIISETLPGSSSNAIGSVTADFQVSSTGGASPYSYVWPDNSVLQTYSKTYQTAGSNPGRGVTIVNNSNGMSDVTYPRSNRNDY